MYRRFIKGFSTIVAPLNECLNKGKYCWGEEQQKSFDLVKLKLIIVLILALPSVDILFEMEIDASRIGIVAVLKQKGRVTEYFSEKLNNTRKK